MKRILALTLCLVMILGLFTGLAGAESEIEPLVVYWQTGPNNFAYSAEINTGISSSFGLNAYTGTTDNYTRINDATFSLVDESGTTTDRLGELHSDYDEKWDIVFSTENAWPNTNGYLRATVGETIYQLPVSVGPASAGVYTNADCTSYLPPKNRTLNTSDSKVCYITIQSSIIGANAPSISDSRFTLEAVSQKTLESITYNVYKLTAPDNFTGTSNVSITCEGLGEWAIPTITFTDGKILSTRWDNGDLTDNGYVPACGDCGVRLTYGLDNQAVPADATVVFKDSSGNVTDTLGEIFYNSNDGRWAWIRNRAIADATGTMEATIGGVTYSRPVTMTAPELSFYSDAACTNYIPYNNLTFLYNGTDPICYVAATMDWIENVELSDSANFTLTPLENESKVYTVSAKDGLAGTHVVEFVATNNNGDRFECEVTFTDGLILQFCEDGYNRFSGTVRAVGSSGGELVYGLSNTPVPSDAVVTVTPDEGTSLEDLGVLRYDPGTNDNGYSWTWIWDRSCARPGASGTYAVTIGDKTYSQHISYILPDLAFYSSADCTPDSYLKFSELRNLTYSSNNMPTLYIQTNYGWNVADWDLNNDNMVVEGVPGKLTLTLKEGTTGDQMGDAQFHLTDGTGGHNYYGMWFQFINRGSLAKAKAEVTNWTNRSADDSRHEIASVTYHGKTYYLVLTNGSDGTNVMDPMRSTGLGLDDEVICDYYVDFCTWSADLNAYQRVDANLSAALFDRFTKDSETGLPTLTFEILPINYTYPNSIEKPTHTPNIYFGPENWPVSYQAVYDQGCGGEFLIKLSGTYTNDDGSTKLCETYATEGIFPIVHKEIPCTTIAEAQAYLNSYHQNTASDMLTIRFNVAELEGHLVIPDSLHNIALHGGYYDENKEWQKTIWRGSVSSGADFGTHLQYFHFIGAGGQNADIDKIPEYWPGTNIPNYAIYGSANGVPHHCIIEGYYHGMHMDQDSVGTHLGGEDTTYYRNVTAVYIDILPNGGGWIGNSGCTFEENGTAMDFVNFPANGLFNMSSVDIERAQFINNDVDVRNTTGQILWMPMNYFIHDKNVNAGSGHSSEKKMTPVLEGSIKSRGRNLVATVPYPLAWDTSFKTYYYPKKITVSNDLLKTYPIRNYKNYLTVNSLSGDDWAVTVHLSDETAAASTVSLLEEETVPEELQGVSYNANVTRKVMDDGAVIVLTFGTVPAGSTATIEMPCAEGWQDATITCNGEVIESTMEDGIIRFVSLPEHSADETVTYEVWPLVKQTSETEETEEGTQITTTTDVMTPSVMEQIGGTLQLAKQEIVNSTGETTAKKVIVSSELTYEAKTLRVMVTGYNDKNQMVDCEMVTLTVDSSTKTVDLTGWHGCTRVTTFILGDGFVPLSNAVEP